MKPTRLSVIIPARDRVILTKKCIDSIWKNSSIFNKIDIYVFDNKSIINKNRLELFYNMLDNGKISYYSYDTPNTMHRCFGKAVVFRRWVDMMISDYEIREKMDDGMVSKTDNYYLLLDNDFIVGPKWGEYMLSSIKQVEKYEKNLHYLVPRPGGVPHKYRIDPEGKSYNIHNVFNPNEKIEIKMANGGGSSGFWFMNYKGMKKLKWDVETMCKTWEIDKRQDTETWNMIRRKNGPIYYVGMVKVNNTPIALHLGSQTGSLCNRLVKDTYKVEKEQISNNEVKFSKMTVDEIWNEYKDKCNRW